MRAKVSLAVLLVLSIAAVQAVAEEGGPKVTVIPSANQAEFDRQWEETAEVARNLFETRLDFSAEEMPLDQALRQIAEEVGIEIDLDRPQLAALRVKVEAPVSISVKDVRAENLLRNLLRQWKLVPAIHSGHVLITSERGEESLGMTTRYYPLQDLSVDENGEFDADLMIDTITTPRDPEAWEDLGGMGVIQVFEEGLAIHQTWAIHQAIEQLMAALRGVQAMPDDQYDVTPRLLAADPEEHARTRAAVRSLTVTLKADQLPLQAAVAHLAEETGLNIVIGTVIDRPLTISGDWRNRPVQQILNQVTSNHKLPWTIEGNIVRIAGSVDRPPYRPPLLVKVYPVRDLRSDRGESLMNPWNRERMQFLDSGGWVAGVFPPPAGWPPSEWRDAMNPYHHLKECIEWTVWPESWERLGGPGSMYFHPGLDCLVVAQDLQIHEEVERLLQQIRANRQEPEGRGNAEIEDPLVIRSYFVLGHVITGELLLEHPEFTQLCHRAAKVIEPDSWNDNEIFMEILTDRVIVRHRQSVQQQIDQFFNATNLITSLNPTDPRRVRGFRSTPHKPAITPSGED